MLVYKHLSRCGLLSTENLWKDGWESSSLPGASHATSKACTGECTTPAFKDFSVALPVLPSRLKPLIALTPRSLVVPPDQLLSSISTSVGRQTIPSHQFNICKHWRLANIPSENQKESQRFDILTYYFLLWFIPHWLQKQPGSPSSPSPRVYKLELQSLVAKSLYVIAMMSVWLCSFDMFWFLCPRLEGTLQTANTSSYPQSSKHRDWLFFFFQVAKFCGLSFQKVFVRVLRNLHLTLHKWKWILQGSGLFATCLCHFYILICLGRKAIGHHANGHRLRVSWHTNLKTNSESWNFVKVSIMSLAEDCSTTCSILFLCWGFSQRIASPFCRMAFNSIASECEQLASWRRW